MSKQSLIHKTSAGGIVYAAGKVLTLRMAKRDEVVFPKGTMELGETPEEAAIREVLEETGYHTKIIAPLGEMVYEFSEANGERYRKTVYYYLLALIDEHEFPSPNRETHENDDGMENLWLSVEEAKNYLTHDDSKQKLAQALALLETV